jgi:two-component system sensor histidine kinase VanS
MGVFAKIFAYTMLLLALMSMAAAALFARQFLSFYRAEQHRQLSGVFEPIIAAMTDRGYKPQEIAELARTFAGNNQSFKFLIRGNDGEVIFSSPGALEAEGAAPGTAGNLVLRIAATGRGRPGAPPPPGPEAPGGRIGPWGYVFTGYGSGPIDYADLAGRSLLALALMIAIAVFGAVLFARKVTKPLEDELVRERAVEENQRLFFSAASHELKTPIAAARALVEGMIAGVGDYGDHPKYLRECMKTLDAQSRLVSEILEIVKISGEGAEPALLSLDPAELAASLAEEYRPLAAGRGIDLRVEVPPLPVRADRQLLRRALSNVIANAVQNTPAGGSVRVGAEEAGNRGLRLRVLNTGAAIPGELLPRLFEPFFHLDPARSGRQSGLGLTLVKKALDRMKVPFALENTPEGVLFWVELPRAGNPVS